MQSTKPLQTAGKALSFFGKCMIVLSPILFHSLLVPLVGWERLIGKGSISYNANHTHIEGVTNPIAWIMWWVLIGMVGYGVMLIGAKLLATGERLTIAENRKLRLLLVGIIILGWILSQAAR